ncbi:MAG: ABC transporter permease [Saprospiraceae bacterium]|nr:MAG: ABC transporter permease [Saprospiraceae bacterium]
MIYNILKIAYRNILKRKLFSAINVIGLAVAMGVSLLLLLTVFHQFSFDNFHKNGDRIYQVYNVTNHSSGIAKGATQASPLKEALESEMPELEHVMRWSSGPASIKYEGDIIESSIRFTDANFFEMFSFQLLEGTPNQVLANLNTVVLSEKTAAKVFGEENPIGKTITLNIAGKAYRMEVSGLVEDEPNNSSLHYNMITRFENHPDYQDNKDNFDNQFLGMFVQLPPTLSQQEAEEKLKGVVHKYRNDEIEQLQKDGAQPDVEGEVYSLKLLPLNDLHFDTEITGNGISIALPMGLLIIAFFILVIVCINFINLTIGTALTRAREVGVRKVLGATKRQLISQFFGEVSLLIFVALFLGLILAQFGLADYNQLFRQKISLYNPTLIFAIGSILVFVGLIGGSYPALVLSRFQPASVLKGSTSVQKPGKLRNILVLLQFTLSVFLIICTMIVWNQIDYLRSKPLGYSKEDVISIPIGNELDSYQVLQRMRNELAANPNVKSITGSYGNLGMGKDGSRTTSIMGFSQGDRLLRTHWAVVDYDYFETLNIPLVEGRSFSPEFPTDSSESIIINETFARQLGEDSPIGTVLDLGPDRKVIGVVKDYHFLPLDKAMEPLSLVLAKPIDDFRLGYIFVSVSNRTAMSNLEETWKKLYPETIFQATFLDENNQRQYQVEESIAKLFTTSGLLAIILSCMGLFGVVVLVTSQRTKEIGIRKVLGASVPSIVGLISKEFILLVAIAIVIAAPMGWWLMKQWLQSYAYSIDFPWWSIPLAGIMAILIAVVTLGIQSVRAALTNPIDALRDE